MVKPRTIAATMIALTIAMTVFTPFASTVADNTGTQSVTNETVTADIGTAVDLNGYDVDSASETVYYTNNTDQSWDVAVEGTDYSMDYGAGSVTALSGGSIDDGETLRVSYDYQATGGTTTTVVQLLPMFLALLVLGVMASKIQDGL